MQTLNITSDLENQYTFTKLVYGDQNLIPVNEKKKAYTEKCLFSFSF